MCVCVLLVCVGRDSMGSSVFGSTEFLVDQGETVQHREEGRRRRVQVQLSYTEAFGLYVVERGEEERRKGGMTWFLKA